MHSDYVGGSLFNYLYGIPILKDNPSSFACSTCLRNPPKFPTLASFNNEYACLPDSTAVAKVFKATAKPIAEMERTLIPGMKDDLLPPGLMPRTPFAVMDYFGYQRLPHTNGLAGLYSRAQMEKWLFGLIMKIALPTRRPAYNDMELVYSPLNLTAFFRVLRTVWDNGYPAHWLSDILTTILNNKVKTMARPPRSYPLKIEETKKELPLRCIDLTPFMMEFRSLTSLWLSELPFGMTGPVPVSPPSKIRQYSIKFSDTKWHGEPKVSVFTLLLADWKYLGPVVASGEYDLRKALLTDEKGEKGPKFDSFRKNCAIVSTWTWSMQNQTASFWLDEGSVANMRRNGWVASILRQDNWELCAAPEVVKGKLIEGEKWM